MTLMLQITVPLNLPDGWSGTKHLPTLTVNAPTLADAHRRVSDILAHLPDGCTYTLTPA